MTYETDRICFVIPSMGLGGSERQLLYLLKGLVNDHELSVICTRNEGALTGEARRLAKVHVLRMLSGWDPRTGRAVEKLFRAYRPAVVHTTMFGFDKSVNAAARRAGVPVVISNRRQLATWKAPRHVRLQRKANAMVDCIVANSRAVADFAIEQEGADPSMFRVVHGAVDFERFQLETDLGIVRQRYTIPFHTKVIGLVANFSPVKDHALFIAIVSELTQRRADVHFVIVGSGPLRSTVLRSIEKAGLSDRVTALSASSELPYLYKLMSVSMLCSKAEGFPNVLMESMASGTPVVASAVGGITEVIEDGATGKLVKSRDPADFADALEWVLDHPEQAKAMAQRAYEYAATQLSVTRMADEYRHLYRELLDRARRTG